MHFWAMARPVPTEPVKLMASTSGALTRAPPTTDPRPLTRLRTPAGRPASASIFTSSQVQAGTRWAGLMTTPLPYARAGSTFPPGNGLGEFQGVVKPHEPPGSAEREG